MNTDNVVNLPSRGAPGVEQGTIKDGSETGYVVQGAAGVFVAKVAFSCLVKPMSGDKVLYTRDSQGSYILAILERPAGDDALISLPGDVIVQSAKGHITFAAASGIDMATGAAVTLRASEVEISAAKGRLNVLDLRATGETFTGTLTKAHLVSEAIDVVAQRVSQRVTSCYRWVEQLEHVTAGEMLTSVKNLFSVRARQSAITAKEDVKIDAQYIHLG